MADLDRFRAVATYSKRGLARYLSHRELLRAFDRAVRRAGLGVQYSQGFSPRAQISFPPPLPVGAEGYAELCSIELARPMEARDVFTALAPELVALPLSHVRVERRMTRSAWARLATASYLITPDWAETVSRQAVADAVEEVLASETLVIHRETKSRTRTLDIRPDIHSLDAEPGNVLHACLGVTEHAFVKPDEIVAALTAVLGIEGGTRHVARTALHFA